MAQCPEGVYLVPQWRRLRRALTFNNGGASNKHSLLGSEWNAIHTAWTGANGNADFVLNTHEAGFGGEVP